jgi:diguanylate cyclase (GGDEF)-like protein
VPISLITLQDRDSGYVIALLSAVIWLVNDLYSGTVYDHPLIPYWNAVVRLIYFLLHATLLSTLMTTFRQERRHAREDPLTAASNWRHFEETAQLELHAARQSGKPIILVYLDLDNFKDVNDTLGHALGDELLQNVVRTLRQSTRNRDVVARLGGDEFALLLLGIGRDEVQHVLQRICRSLQGMFAELKAVSVTASVGAITFNEIPPTLEEMVRHADQLMYTVKNSGKNQCRHAFWPEPSDPTPPPQPQTGENL